MPRNRITREGLFWPDLRTILILKSCDLKHECIAGGGITGFEKRVAVPSELSFCKERLGKLKLNESRKH